VKKLVFAWGKGSNRGLRQVRSAMMGTDTDRVQAGVQALPNEGVEPTPRNGAAHARRSAYGTVSVIVRS
jgi:hypothetical protein